MSGCQTNAQHTVHMIGWWICGIATCFCCNNCCSLCNDKGMCCLCRFGDPNQQCKMAEHPENKAVSLWQEKLKWEQQIDEVNLSLKHIVARLDEAELAQLTIPRNEPVQQTMSGD
jgi:hypothetical protein